MKPKRPRGRPRAAAAVLVPVTTLLTAEEREWARERGPTISAAIRGLVVAAMAEEPAPR